MRVRRRPNGQPRFVGEQIDLARLQRIGRGRSINLREVILRHGGEAQAARNAFELATGADQRAVLAFLESLVLFPPPDTASNLDPSNPGAVGFPRVGHGSIKLSVLFNNPAVPE